MILKQMWENSNPPAFNFRPYEWSQSVTLGRSFDFSRRGADGFEGAHLAAFENLLDQGFALVLEQIPAEKQISGVAE